MKADPVPLPARYPKTTMYTLWGGAILSAMTLAYMYPETKIGGNSMLKHGLQIALWGMGCGLAWNFFLMASRVIKVRTYALLTGVLGSFCGIIIATDGFLRTEGFSRLVVIFVYEGLFAIFAYMALFLLAIILFLVRSKLALPGRGGAG